MGDKTQNCKMEVHKMTTNGTKYGISYLPEDCLAYFDGYRFGAYKRNLSTGETHITEFFKTKDEIQAFVNANPEYGKPA